MAKELTSYIHENRCCGKYGRKIELVRPKAKKIKVVVCSKCLKGES